MAKEEAQKPDGGYRAYMAEIDLYEREFKPWETRAKKIVKLYKDADNNRGTKKRFNVLWSNVQTLKPALYARDPQPVAERRFKDADPVGRLASEVLERCLAYTIDCQDLGQTMRQVVDDRLLPGRGTTWIRYCPTFDKVQISEEADDYDKEKGGEQYSEELAYEEVKPDYVYWEDFGHNIARTWDEVNLVWRRVYLTRAQLVERFKEAGQTIPLDYTPKGLKDEKQAQHVSKACIYELWDKEKGKIVFLSKAHPKIIEQRDKPLNLTGCFPCPRPLFATLTNDSLVPVPDYALYQTQAQEIEELTARINSLQKALKVAGVYDSSAPQLARLLNEGFENKLIPVDTWAAFAEKGGIAGAIEFLPVKEIAEALIGLYEAREKSKEDLYELTGIADIIRGNSDPRETAKAQQIKGRFAVLRISDAQADVQRYARDVMRLMAEVIAENFSLDTIKAISGVRLLTEAEKAMLGQAQQSGKIVPPDAADLLEKPTWEQVHSLLSNQVLREFRIDIETDSTIRTDEDADRVARTEFLTAAGTYIRNVMEASAQAPEMAPLLSELLMFGVRSFRQARSLEPAFEDAIRKLEQSAKQPRPDPEAQKLQQEAQLQREKMQLDVQSEQAKQELQHQEEMARQQMEDQRAERDAQRTAELERFKAELEMQLTREKIAAETEAKIQVAQIQAASDRENGERDASVKLETERMKGEQADKDRQFQERTRAEDKENGEAKKQYDGERDKSRKDTLAAAQKLIDALSQLRSTVH